MEFSLTLPSPQVPITPAHVCIRSCVAAFPLHNRRITCSNITLLNQHEALSQRRPFLCSIIRANAGESASPSAEGEEELKVSSEGDGGGGEEVETDEEYDRKLHEDFQKKADQMLKDAIENFVQSDIEDAAKKYDMEEELFAEIDFAQVNAFTDQPFSGNPAAVCYLPLKRTEEWMQLVAREFNLSETAFLIKRNTKNRRSPVFKKSPEEELAEETTVLVDEFDLRWFTPKVEVDLCGHATLASAHLLFSSGIASTDTILFHTKSGVLKAKKISGYDELKATKREDKSDDLKTDNSEELQTDNSEDLKRGKRRPIGVGVVELDFPLVTYTQCDDAEARTLSAALGGVKLSWAGKTSSDDYLVEVSSNKEIMELQPQFSRMLDLSAGRGVIVTASADSGVDFVSRFFAPKCGINEDPVTGSAHCALGPFWAERLGKTTLKAYQASDRGGYIEVCVDRSEGRVYLQGSSVLVMAGVLLNTLRAQGNS